MTLGSIPSMSEWVHANTSKFCPKKSEIALCTPLGRVFYFFYFQDPGWLFVVDGEVDQVFNGPSSSLLAWRSRINGVIEGSLTWRPLIDNMELPWLGSCFYSLMVALPRLLLVSLDFAYPSGGREFHQEVVNAGYDPQFP